MITSIVEFLWTAIESGFGYLDEIFTSIGLSFIEFFMGLALIGALYKFVLSPYLVGSGSDNATYKNKTMRVKKKGK